MKTIYQAITMALCIGPLNEVEQRLYRDVENFIATCILEAVVNSKTKEEAEVLLKIKDKLLRRS